MQINLIDLEKIKKIETEKTIEATERLIQDSPQKSPYNDVDYRTPSDINRVKNPSSGAKSEDVMDTIDTEKQTTKLRKLPMPGVAITATARPVEGTRLQQQPS